MPAKHTAEIVVADAVLARYLHCSVAPLDRCHVEQRDEVRWQADEREYGRPQPRAGLTGNTSESHEHEEQLNRAAKQLLAWMKRKVVPPSGEPLVLFVPPRLIGALRRAGFNGLSDHVQLHEADLAKLDATALARHGAIQQLVGLGRPRGHA